MALAAHHGDGGGNRAIVTHRLRIHLPPVILGFDPLLDSIPTVCPTPQRVILGLDPGIRCMGEPVKGLGAVRGRRLPLLLRLLTPCRSPGQARG
ncbi:hypothetical protein SAMN05428936_11111 [Pelagibacterium halotolerans]|nr:hypothetical protein SAMN05428936_11111 [Pelagibacterium halotolerans]